MYYTKESPQGNYIIEKTILGKSNIIDLLDALIEFSDKVISELSEEYKIDERILKMKLLYGHLNSNFFA